MNIIMNEYLKKFGNTLVFTIFFLNFTVAGYTHDPLGLTTNAFIKP